MERSENRNYRESRRWPYAFAAVLLGLMLGVLIVMAVRGPSTVVVNGNNCCCQCGQPCVQPESSRPFDAPRTSDRIPVLPAPEPRYREPPVDPSPEPLPDTKETDRIAGFIPVIPWFDTFGGAGGSGKRDEQGTLDSVPVPIPGSAALLAAGLLAWRLS